MLSAQGEDPGVRDYATTATERELDALTNLVRDVRAVAAVEREGFGIKARPLPLEELLADAEVYASTLPGHHPIEVMVRGDLRVEACVLADPERVSGRSCATYSRTLPNTRQKARPSSCG